MGLRYGDQIAVRQEGRRNVVGSIGTFIFKTVSKQAMYGRFEGHGWAAGKG
jgi:hypothetical protein